MITQQAGVLLVTAPMTLATAKALRAEGCAAMSSGDNVFDLSAVPEADSASLAVMLAWLRHAKNARSTVKFIHVPESVLSLATLYGVLELIQVGPACP